MEPSAREKLLTATVDHVAETGLRDFSLRSAAAAIGTSHRMLIHHFGSKAGLESAIVERATELLTIPLVDPESDHPQQSPRDQVLRVWEALSDPGLDPLVRLYFDLSNRATAGDPIAAKAVETIRDHWTQTASTISADLGNLEEHLLGAAVTSTFLKGLLLDRLTGANLVETERILHRFIELVESYNPTGA